MSSLTMAPVAPHAAPARRRSWPPIPLVVGVIVLLPPTVALAVTALVVEAKTAIAESLVRRAWARTCASGRPAAPWDGASAQPVARVLLPEAGLDAIVLNEAAVDGLGPIWIGEGGRGEEPRGIVIAGSRPDWLRHLRRALPGHTMTLDWLDRDERRVRTRSYRVERATRSTAGARVGADGPGDDALILVALPLTVGGAHVAESLVVRATPLTAR